ncbi:MAG: HesA/MoeB/ThiF family protein [Paracoccaceae bacterium]|nr:MAG: HesA/MoeB/ThiF family protein [Paracoccaceae bacterium]
MAMILAMAAVLWGVGMALRTPVRIRLIMLAALWAGVVLLHLVLAAGHPLRLATGGDARPWLALGVVVAAVAAYRMALARLRARAAPVAAAALPRSGFREAELNRYARHIMLREVGGTGQRRLKAARVLVVGAGGLGSPALLYLAAAGVGTIGVIDDDTVDGTNLQRQIVHADDRIGMPKVFSAEAAMRALNPFVEVRPFRRRLTAEIAPGLIGDFDLVLDGSDNFDTRYLVNRACAQAGVPLVAGAITQWEGQVSVYDPARGAPCYECVFPVRPAPGMVPTCAEAGVIASLPGVIGAIMATEALKHLAGAGDTLAGQLMIHDALHAETRVIAVKRRADCACCGDAARAGWTAPAPAP